MSLTRFREALRDGSSLSSADDMGKLWKGGGGDQEVTQSTEPWAPQQPYLKDVLSGAQDLYNTDATPYYPGQTFPNFSPETAYALTAQTQRALNGSPLVGQAQQQLDDTISGRYLGSNPYLDQEFSRVTDQIGNTVDSGFSKAGRYGSGLYASELAKQTGQAASQFYGENYRKERENQLKATAFAPSFANQDYFDVGQLAAVGDVRNQLAQKDIDDSRARYEHNDSYNQQLRKLRDYSGLVGGNYGQQSTQNTDAGGNDLASTLGTLGLGASLLSGGVGGNLSGFLGDSLGGLLDIF